jgi:hypothetical protein
VEGFCNLPGYFLASSAVRALGSGGSFLGGCVANGLVRVLAGVWVGVSGARQYSLLPLELCHGMNQAGLQALLIEAGEQARFRRAHLRGCLMSLDSLSSLCAAPLWAWWYATCVSSGRPRRFFLGHALCTLGQLVASAAAAAAAPPTLSPAAAALSSPGKTGTKE